MKVWIAAVALITVGCGALDRRSERATEEVIALAGLVRLRIPIIMALSMLATACTNLSTGPGVTSPVRSTGLPTVSTTAVKATTTLPPEPTMADLVAVITDEMPPPEAGLDHAATLAYRSCRQNYIGTYEVLAWLRFSDSVHVQSLEDRVLRTRRNRAIELADAATAVDSVWGDLAEATKLWFENMVITAGSDHIGVDNAIARWQANCDSLAAGSPPKEFGVWIDLMVEMTRTREHVVYETCNDIFVLGDEGRKYYDGLAWSAYECVDVAENVVETNPGADYYELRSLIAEEFFLIVGGPLCVGTVCVTAYDFD